MISNTQWSEDEKRVIGLVDGSITPMSGLEAHFVLYFQEPKRLASPEEKLWLAIVERERGRTRPGRPWISYRADQFWDVLSNLVFKPTTKRIIPYPNIYQQTLEELIGELSIRKKKKNVLALIECVNRLLSLTSNRDPQEIGELIGSSSIGKELIDGERFADLWQQNNGQIAIPNKVPLKKFFTDEEWNLKTSVISVMTYPAVARHGHKFDQTKWILDIKKGDSGTISKFVDHLEKKISKGVTLTYVPSSRAENKDTGIRQLVRRLAEQGQFTDATDCVVRHTSLPYSRGDKDEEVIRNSIRVENPEKIRGKNVLILDDITTSGASMRACTRLLMEAGAHNVRCVAMGLTDTYDPADLKDLIKLDPETTEEIARPDKKDKLEQVTDELGSGTPTATPKVSEHPQTSGSLDKKSHRTCPVCRGFGGAESSMGCFKCGGTGFVSD